ncbi:MAG: efflux RND transporter periplasmic adaptor subunit [Deltaproteobacteria bacterium]|nr:efflux RND transporter periplasmic adaptor subunit [Deltaproteobacteria bacterium]
MPLGRKITVFLLVMALPFSLLFVVDAESKNSPAPVVTVITVAEQEVNPPEAYVGRVEAIQAVDLRARVQGYLEQVKFKEGADVRSGDLLYVIEQAPYKAIVDEERAKMAEADASLKDAQQYLKRLRAVRSGGVSKTDLETAANRVLKAAALLKEAQANLEQARINLGYTTIEAPISGRIGKTSLTKGNLVGPESGSLARIVQLDPIRVVYSVSEMDLAKIGRAPDFMKKDHSDTCPSVPLIRMPNGEMYPLEGRVDFVDNEVDPDTGTIAVRAVFENPDGFLLPGQYVTVLVRCKEGRRLPVVPQSAVQVDQDGRYVFVVDEQDQAQIRRIETGKAAGPNWVVHSGLKAGERIVTQGVQKVTPGQRVQTVPEGEATGD